MDGEGHGQASLLGGVLAQLCEMTVDGWLATSESDTEPCVRVKLVKLA
jgi:hypothetical protein